MDNKYFTFALIVGFAALIHEGNALKCYRCNDQNNEACNKGLSSLEVHDCPNSSDKCEAYGYELLEGDKVVSNGYQRGCLSEMGSCSLIYKSMSTLISSSTGGKQIFKEKACNVCENDLCNTQSSSARIQVPIFSLIAFVLITRNF